MNDIQELEEHLPDGHGLSHEELVTLNDLLETQADLILDLYLQDKADGKIT
jgi:hypothetical protein